MNQFTEKYRAQITGVLSGFDRLVFRGTLLRLYHGYWDHALQATVAKGMEEYLWQNKIHFKDYAAYVKQTSERVKQASLRKFEEQKLKVMFVRSAKADKEGIARQFAMQQGITQGPVCALSCLEPTPTYEHRGIHIICRERPCQVLYHYQIHPQLGWLYARLQTWFPFNIQVGCNGREWLARQMDRHRLKYRQQGNCFVWIEDFVRAQRLLQQQLRMNWAKLLNTLATQLNPIHASIFRNYPAEYYWTCYQSEWATDVNFRDPEFLKRLMPILVRHAMLSHSSPDIMRYFGRKLTQSGAVPGTFNGTLQSDLKRRVEGERVKYRMNGNSLKFYDKAYSQHGAVLRAAETTINDVKDFRVFRPKAGGPKDDLQWRQMRKSIADLHRRAEVSDQSNERLLDALAQVDDTQTLNELTAAVQRRTRWNGRSVRALYPWAEDKALLAATNHGEFLLNGFRNRDLQRLLYDSEATEPDERRRRSAVISRKIRLLRAHRLVMKVGRTHRYQITNLGRAILNAVLTVGRTTLHQLNQLAQAA